MAFPRSFRHATLLLAAATLAAACADTPTENTAGNGSGFGPLASSTAGDSDGDGVGDATDVEPTRTNRYAWVDWQSADVAGGTATGTITLAGGATITVNLRVADPDGPAPVFGYTNNGVNIGGISGFPYHNWFSSTPSAYESPYVLNHPTFDDDIIALGGGQESGHPLSSYVITFTPAVSDPALAIMSLGAGGNEAVYDFDRSFELVSQGTGRFGGGSTSLTIGAGETLHGREGNGTIRFLGSFSTFSWTVPDGEIWHGFTIGVRGLADPNADTDGDGVPDVSDNCPATANSSQSDSDGDGIGNACDSADDGAADTDGDGLTNAEEVVIGTSPTNPDTDGDGFNDLTDAFPLDPTRSTADDTPPAITADVTGTLGDNGWYTSDVGVAWTVTDGESAVTSTTGCDPSTVTTDTNGASITCSATSTGGSASQSVTVKRDATAPVVGFAGNAGSYTVDQTIAITCSASDAMSDLASSACPGASGDAYTFGTGTHTLSASATDNAGNSASASATFTVSVTSGSLCALVQRWVSQRGVANSMCQQLRNGAYGAFRNHVSAQSGKFVSAAHAAVLIALSNEL